MGRVVNPMPKSIPTQRGTQESPQIGERLHSLYSACRFKNSFIPKGSQEILCLEGPCCSESGPIDMAPDCGNLAVRGEMDQRMGAKL